MFGRVAPPGSVVGRLAPAAPVDGRLTGAGVGRLIEGELPIEGRAPPENPPPPPPPPPPLNPPEGRAPPPPENPPPPPTRAPPPPPPNPPPPPRPPKPKAGWLSIVAKTRAEDRPRQIQTRRFIMELQSAVGDIEITNNVSKGDKNFDRNYSAGAGGRRTTRTVESGSSSPPTIRCVVSI